MRFQSCLLACAFCFIIIQGANAQALDQDISQGFHGLVNQVVAQGAVKTYTLNLAQNASFLFAGILANEGTPSLELQDSSGYSYGMGESVIVENAKPGVYTITVIGNGKYAIFWDSLDVPKAIPPSLCQKPGDSCRLQAADSISVNFPACTTMDKGLFGFLRPSISTCDSTEVVIPDMVPAWFLVNASDVSAPQGFGKPGNIISITVADYDQGGPNFGLVQALIYPIDENKDMTTAYAYERKSLGPPPYYIFMDNNQGVTRSLYANQSYLVKVNGYGSMVSVYYR